MSAPTSTEKKSKFKFSNLLHSKDKDTTTTTNPPRNSNSDSGYGGSEPSVTEPYIQNIPPSLTGSDESRNNPNDQNATVTTTTTTTTTTTSGGGGLNTTVENSNDNSNAPQNQSENGSRNEQGGSPPIPMRSSLRDRSPNPPMQGSGNSTIRDRSPIPGTSPSSRTNFSYPNRGPFVQSAPPPPQQQQQQPPQAQQSTLQGLKSAAVGIHGASETLRGTLNSAVDRHTNAPPDILAEHERTIQGGRQEMERMHEGRANPAPPKGILKKVQR